ncbi:AAA family ATPase [Tetragenococcus solitarius]|uniref:Kinase n=1 Tax=Tetragenococcus solitarius TaxID=71453 RepID=A0ABP6KIW1_9ENTE|nr:AAA family ATPase [Tetragenococcus solitarius]
MSTLIILRGNSGSGKTTIAHDLQKEFKAGSLLVISQDLIRREMLGVKDRPNNLAIHFIKMNAIYGKRFCDYIVVEGITPSAIYREMFIELASEFQSIYPYYFDLPFEETLKRHNTKEKAQEYGVNELKKWWIDKDFLHFPNEKMITAEMNQQQIIDMILKDLIF